MLRLTDWYTDDLFANGFPDECISHAQVSRLVIDVERFVDDELEACSQVGMGVTYTKTSRGAMLRDLSPTRREQLLGQYYWPHHRRLDQMAQAMLARYDRCVILDAHSFPTQALPTQVDFGTPPEIGIGTDTMHTSEDLRELAEAYFRRQGLSVGVDRPFSGTMVPNTAFRKDRRVQSVMIEVRRDLYMDEALLKKVRGSERCRTCSLTSALF